ncbi:MAG: hypothetical protein V4584_02230 [Verrucomicrobiota bacterium]
MFRKTFLLLVVGLLGGSGALLAQNPADPTAEGGTTEKPKAGDSPGPNRFWQTSLSGGHYMVPLDRIVSISRHKYVLDGSLIVDEVTIDTLGQALARFYVISPLTDKAPGDTIQGVADRGRELLDEVAEKAGSDTQNMVVKKYPETTHAKTIEYRLLKEKDLTALYNSVRSAWESGRGRQYNEK